MGKRAYEYSREYLLKDIPTWERADELDVSETFNESKRQVEDTKKIWKMTAFHALSHCFMMSDGIASMELMGYDISSVESLIDEALDAVETNKDMQLLRLTGKVKNALLTLPKNLKSKYWNYTNFETFEQFEKAAKLSFGSEEYLQKIAKEELSDRIYAGWLLQLIGGAVGNLIEGHHTLNIEKVFGNKIDRFYKDPDMFNDDLTYQLVFHKIFCEKGYSITATDIGEEWLARIPVGFTAERVALDNLRLGIYPPMSGSFNNPYCEWIGAQMRGGICGMVAPANPKKAAELAWADASVSHSGNGIIGEVFNAIMCSMAFEEKDMRTVLKKAIEMLPEDCQYYSVVKYAWNMCEKYGNWRDAWLDCDEKYKEYSWIHAYPNAAAEVIALYFCDNDFDQLISIVALEGADTDCNAAQVACVFGCGYGISSISSKWLEKIPDITETYVRGMRRLSIKELAKSTVEAIYNANKTC